MDYELMIPPFQHNGYEEFNKKQAEEYFQWYVGQTEYRIDVLNNFLINEGKNIVLDFSPESLIPLWDWYEGKIIVEQKSEVELQKEIQSYPDWMKNEISTTKISLQTYKFGMDIAIYFAEIIRKNSEGKIQWGYFTKPKNRASVNQPVLLGFKARMDLNPRLVIVNCTRRSSKEQHAERLIEMYYTWMKYVE